MALGADINFKEGDVDLSNLFTPIGDFDSSKSFTGTFDGQGHTIINLNINTTAKGAGLFGFTTASTIKNVVIESTCTVISSVNTLNAYIGGIVGLRSSYQGTLEIENCVNMASLSYTGRYQNVK